MSLLFTFVILFVFLASEGRVHAQTKTSLPNAFYTGLSSDSTGSYLTAVADVGPIYYSNDSGVSWKVSDAPRDYYLAVAASSTGQYVIAGSDSKTLVSSDYGQHFTAVTSKAAEHVAVSSTGQYMVSNTGGYTFSPNTCLSYSNNYGASFTTGLGPPNYNNRTACGGVGIDSSGTYVVLAVDFQGLWVSNNVTDISSWKLTYEADTYIKAIAFGGTSFYAGYWSIPGYLIQSPDYGYTWILKSALTANSNAILSLAVDSTGVNVLVASYIGLYLSQDSGDSYETIYPTNSYVCAMNGNTTLAIWTVSEPSHDFDVYVGNPLEMTVASAPNDSDDDALSPGIIAAIAVGSFALCCVIACIFIRLYFGRFLICWPSNEPLKETFLSNVQGFHVVGVMLVTTLSIIYDLIPLQLLQFRQIMDNIVQMQLSVPVRSRKSSLSNTGYF